MSSGTNFGSLGTAFVDVVLDSKKLQRDLGALGQKMTAAGKEMTAALTVPLAGIGVAAGKLASDFDRSIRKVNALVGVATSQTNKWRGELLKLSGELGSTPQQLAEGLFFITSAGLRGADAMEALEAAAKGAAIGLGEVETIADATTSALNVYGSETITATRATAILAATVREGKAAAESLPPVFGRILGTAEEMGVTFDQVGATLAAMTRTGSTAAEAGTRLNAILVSLLKPASDTEEALARIGTSAQEVRADIAERGLFQALMALRGAIGENQAEFAKLFPNVRALGGFLALTGEAAEANAGIFQRLAEVTEDELNVALEQSKGAGFEFDRAMAQLQATLITIGDTVLPQVVPLVQDLGAGLAEAARQFGALHPETQQTVIQVAAFTAALGPATIAAGAFVTALTTIGGQIAIIAAGLGLLVIKLDELHTAMRELDEQRLRQTMTPEEIAINRFDEASRQFAEMTKEMQELGFTAEAIQRVVDDFKLDMEGLPDDFNASIEDALRLTEEMREKWTRLRSELEAPIEADARPPPPETAVGGSFDSFVDPDTGAVGGMLPELAPGPIAGMPAARTFAPGTAPNLVGGGKPAPFPALGVEDDLQAANEENQAINEAALDDWLETQQQGFEKMQLTAEEHDPFDVLAESLLSFKEMAAEAMLGFSRGFGQAFADFATGVASAKEAFKRFALSFINQTIAMIAQQAILAAFVSITSFGSAPAAGAASFNAALASMSAASGQIVNAASGLDGVVHGPAGTDRALIAMRATKGEIVSVRRPDQMGAGAGGAPMVQIFNSTGEEVRTRRGPDPKQVRVFIGGSAAEDVTNGGQLAAALEQTYGLRRGGVS